MLGGGVVGLDSGFFQDVNVILAITNLKIGQQINIKHMGSRHSDHWMTLEMEIRKYRDHNDVVAEGDTSPVLADAFLTILTPSCPTTGASPAPTY